MTVDIDCLNELCCVRSLSNKAQKYQKTKDFSILRPDLSIYPSMRL